MLKHRSSPYIVGTVGICIVSLLIVSCYRAYQNHVEFKAFMSNAQTFNRSIEGQHSHSSHDHTHHSEEATVDSDSEKTGPGGQTDSGHEHPYQVGRTSDGDYAYNIAGHLYASKEPMSQNLIEIHEWIQTGKITPAVEEAMRTVEEDRREMSQEKVVQTVVTPDGKLHQVIVPPWMLYEEEDAILQSELDPPEIEQAALAQMPWMENKVEIDGIWHSPPEEYYSIEDPYERRAYFNKFTWSIQYDVSMDEVERQIAAGDMPSPLSESEKRRVDEMQSMIERIKMLAPSAVPLSDKPPVKVRFLPDEGEDALPGWMRKGNSNSPSKGGKVASETDSGSEGSISHDINAALDRTDVPVSPSDPSDMVKTTPSRQSEVGAEASNKTPTPPTAESIETQLREQLSPEGFDKVQQLIDQYGQEEGLRRLRETDPDTARQFEHTQRRRKTDTEP